MTRQFTIAQPAATVIDPHLTTDRRANLGIRFSAYEALVGRDANAGFVPKLATAWTVEQDARTWSFSLRDNVLFHDGQRFGARHVAESLRRVLDPDIGGELGTAGVIQAYLDGVQIEVIDDLTVRLVTATPMADLLDLLVDLPITSASLAGTGPYVVDDQAPGKVAMKAFPVYWNGPPTYDRLNWVAIPDASQRLSALLAGEVDLIADVPKESVSGLRGRTDLETTEQWSPTCVAFLLRCFDGPCSDSRVRRALNHGLDVSALIRDVVDGDAQHINGPLTSLHMAWDPTIAPYEPGPTLARQLLTEAGFGTGLEITVDIPTSLPDEAPALAAGMAEQWERIGVHAVVRQHENREQYAETVRSKAIGDAACFDSSPLSSFRVLREKLHSGIAGPWWQGYANREVDALLDRAAATVDFSARQAIYRQAYRMIHEDAPWLFLYQPAYRWMSRSGFRWTPTPAGWIEVR